MNAPQDFALTTYKPALRAMNDAMSTYLRAVARIHETALSCVGETLSLASDISKEIEAAKESNDFMQLQAKILRLWSEQSMQNWSRAWEAIVANQSEVLRYGAERTAGLGKDMAGAGASQPFAQSLDMSPLAGWFALMSAASRSMGLEPQAAVQKSAHGSASGEHARRAH